MLLLKVGINSFLMLIIIMMQSIHIVRWQRIPVVIVDRLEIMQRIACSEGFCIRQENVSINFPVFFRTAIYTELQTLTERTCHLMTHLRVTWISNEYA